MNFKTNLSCLLDSKLIDDVAENRDNIDINRGDIAHNADNLQEYFKDTMKFHSDPRPSTLDLTQLFLRI